MQQYPIYQEPRFCYKCHFPAAVSDAKCPRCGGPLKTQKSIRILGGVLVFLGGLISAMMVGVMALMLGIFSQTPASKLRGDEDKMMLALGIVGLTFAVGVAFIAAGVWQIIFGKRNGLIVWIALIMVGVLLVVGKIFTSFY
jgi:uncharacterized paraquat-inducible protein A